MPNPNHLETGQPALLFLDTNIWNKLARGHTAEARECCDFLRSLVASGRLLCPVTAPIVWELYKQTYESAHQVALLMDELSLSKCFASRDDVRDTEVAHYVECTLAGRSNDIVAHSLLRPVGWYLSDRGRLSFDPWWSQADRAALAEQFATALNALTVSQLVDLRKDALPVPEIDRVRPFAEAHQRRAEAARGSKKAAWHIEAKALYESTLAPRMERLQPHRRAAFLLEHLRRPIREPKAQLYSHLQHLPSMLLEVEVHTLSGLDTRRRDSMRDFYDLEMLSFPYPYVDAFATEDRWIRHLLSLQPVFLPEWPTPLLSSFSDIIRFARQLG